MYTYTFCILFECVYDTYLQNIMYIHTHIGLIQNWKDQQTKAKDLLIAIYSLLTLIQKHSKGFRESLAMPLSNLHAWAPWMLKFLFQQQGKYSRERELATSLATSVLDTNNSTSGGVAYVSNDVILIDHDEGDSIPKTVTFSDTVAMREASLDNTTGITALAQTMLASKGPYLVVYGDSEEDRELTWEARNDRALALLQSLLMEWGGDLNALLPQDTFTQGADLMELESIPDLIPTDRYTTLHTILYSYLITITIQHT